MTIKELYEWAINNGYENEKIFIQYRDEGGDYYGEDENLYLMYEKDKGIIL